jgi:hypothetical protein
MPAWCWRPIQPRNVAAGFHMIEILQTQEIADFRSLPSCNLGSGVEPMRLGTVRFGALPFHPATAGNHELRDQE